MSIIRDIVGNSQSADKGEPRYGFSGLRDGTDDLQPSIEIELLLIALLWLTII